MAPSTAWSMSASSRMMLADLPPSSRVTFFTPSDAIRMISRPTSVLPVKATLSTSGWLHRVLPSSPPGPVTTLMTPLGMPAARAASAMIRALSGVGCRLQHHRVPHGDGLGDLPEGHARREVPRDDPHAHADRLPPEVVAPR